MSPSMSRPRPHKHLQYIHSNRTQNFGEPFLFAIHVNIHAVAACNTNQKTNTSRAPTRCAQHMDRQQYAKGP